MSKTTDQTSTRRHLLVGAGAAGAAAVAVSAVPLVQRAPVPAATVADAATPKDGYQLTAHVQRYYQTARV